MFLSVNPLISSQVTPPVWGETSNWRWSPSIGGKTSSRRWTYLTRVPTSWRYCLIQSGVITILDYTRNNFVAGTYLTITSIKPVMALQKNGMHGIYNHIWLLHVDLPLYDRTFYIELLDKTYCRGLYATPCGGVASRALGLRQWTETKHKFDVEWNIYLLDLGMALKDSQILALKALQEWTYILSNDYDT